MKTMADIADESRRRNAPADLVEVVRCKDCKWQRKLWHKDKRMKEGGYWLYRCARNDDPFVIHTVDGEDDDYCSCGERKGGDG